MFNHTILLAKRGLPCLGQTAYDAQATVAVQHLTGEQLHCRLICDIIQWQHAHLQDITVTPGWPAAAPVGPAQACNRLPQVEDYLTAMLQHSNVLPVSQCALICRVQDRKCAVNSWICSCVARPLRRAPALSCRQPSLTSPTSPDCPHAVRRLRRYIQ
jgi:hypothetical protein